MRTDRQARQGVRAVAYVRVSKEREDMISPDLQDHAVAEYCARMGYRIVERLVDLDLSGRFWARRQVEHAVELIETGQADVLVVWRWSRVSRSRLDWALAVDRIEAVGGRLESATEAFDTGTSTGRFARGVLAELAAFEAERIADVFREAQARRIRLGLPPLGGPRFGYRIVDGQYEIDRKEGPALAEMYRRVAAGHTRTSVIHWLNRRHLPVPGHRAKGPWNHEVLARILNAGFGAGYIQVHGRLLPGSHEPVISQAEWQAFLDQASSRVRVSVDPDEYLLHRALFCSCGNRMVSTTRRDNQTHPGYLCARHRSPGGRTRVIDEAHLRALALAWLSALATDNAVGASARRSAARYANTRYRTYRRQTLNASAGDEQREDDTRADAATDNVASLIPDPVRAAADLLADWGRLGMPMRRARLALLATRISVRTGHAAALIVTTPWRQRLTYTEPVAWTPHPENRHRQAPVRPDLSASRAGRNMRAAVAARDSQRRERLNSLARQRGYNTPEELIAGLYQGGATILQVQHLTHTAAATVRAALRACDVPIRPGGTNLVHASQQRARAYDLRAARRINTPDITAWLRAQHDDGQTVAQLARTTGRSWHWVKSRLDAEPYINSSSAPALAPTGTGRSGNKSR